MTPTENLELAYYLKQFEDEIKSHLDFYNHQVRMILTIPLVINAGAAIALASFFYKNNPNPDIKSAATCFILGTIFGIATLIFEFFAARFDWSHFNEYLFSFKQKTQGVPDKILTELKEYYLSYPARYKKISSTVLLRIINGAISVIFCFLGIYFIASYLSITQCTLTVISALFATYCTIALIFMYHKYKP